MRLSYSFLIIILFVGSFATPVTQSRFKGIANYRRKRLGEDLYDTSEQLQQAASDVNGMEYIYNDGKHKTRGGYENYPKEPVLNNDVNYRNGYKDSNAVGDGTKEELDEIAQQAKYDKSLVNALNDLHDGDEIETIDLPENIGKENENMDFGNEEGNDDNYEIGIENEDGNEADETRQKRNYRAQRPPYHRARIIADEKPDFSIQETRSETGPDVEVSNDGIEFKPLGGAPNGPLGTQQELERQYGDYFSPNAQEEIRWEEPKLMKNCWAQAMLNYIYGFSPSCNEDGTFSPKQCSLQRTYVLPKHGRFIPTKSDSNICVWKGSILSKT